MPIDGNCEKAYVALDGEDRIETPAGPLIEAEAQHAVHGPQCAPLPPLSSLWAVSSACECFA